MGREVLWTGNCVPAGNVNLIFSMLVVTTMMMLQVEMVIVTTFVRYAEYIVMTREKLGDLVKVSQMPEQSWQQTWKKFYRKCKEGKYNIYFEQSINV